MISRANTARAMATSTTAIAIYNELGEAPFGSTTSFVVAVVGADEPFVMLLEAVVDLLVCLVLSGSITPSLVSGCAASVTVTGLFSVVFSRYTAQTGGTST